MVYRRASDLVCYWRDGHLLLHNFRTGTILGGTPGAIDILGFFDDWRSLREFASARPDVARARTARSLEALASSGLLEVRRRRPARPLAPSGWAPWNPAAGFFHFSTKDAFGPLDDAGLATADNWDRLAGSKRPALFKVVAGQRTSLPAPAAQGQLPRVLEARRTWRRFGASPLSLAHLSTLLYWTWGVQHAARNAQGYRFALRTSPSGGALQPIEAYVVALNVKGLPAGAYHYHPLDHSLVRVRSRVSRVQVRRYLAGQSWFLRTAAIVFMSGMFARTQWKYSTPRAYRTVLTEAGHFCQTFCLVATWLGLAPFCTQALADTLIERDLGIDGVEESILYAAGVGTRPPSFDPRQPLDAGHPDAP